MYNRRKFILGATAIAAPMVIASGAQAKPIHLKIAHNNAPNTAAHVAAIAFQKFMTERGGGRFEIEVYAYSMLGNEVQLARGLAEGTLDGCIAANSSLGLYADETTLIEYPYLFSDLKHARSSLDGKLGAHIASKLEKKGMLIIGWSENGMRHITANRPVRTPADLKGLKMRVQPIKVHVEVFKALGAAPGPMIWTELPSAMRTGVFEAQENPITNIAANDFLVQMQSHLSMTGHVYSPYPLVFSKATFNRLMPADRDLVMEGGAIAASESRRFGDDAMGPAIEKLKSGGMKIIADVDVPMFMRAVQGMNAEMARHHNAGALQAMRSLIA